MTDTDLNNTSNIQDLTNSVNQMSETELKTATEKEMKKFKAYLQHLKMKNFKMHLIPFPKSQRKARKNRRRAFAAGFKNIFGK